MQIFEFVIANFHLAHLKIQQTGLESQSIGAVVRDVYNEISHQEVGEDSIRQYANHVASKAHKDLINSVKKHKGKKYNMKKDASNTHDFW